ncbi:MAG: FtsX-like permease family protein [Cyanothece sp. SIO1E1]|nr:FtsX-like permease family protein [Cyanothece sp. SIO1E1]
MLKNYFKIALRYFKRNKLYTAINVLGLSVGIAACLVISLIINYESSFDKFWKDKDSIYRVYSSFSGVFDGVNRGVATAVGPWLKENATGIEEVVAFHTFSAPVTILSVDGSQRELERQRMLALAGPDYFRVFSKYRWLAGSPEESLGKPNQVVLTSEKAELYFGLEQVELALGRTIQYRDSIFATVSGIIEHPTQSTDFDFNEFISYSTIENSPLKRRIALNDWQSTNSSSQLFIKLDGSKTEDEVEALLVGAKETYQAQNDDAGYAADYKLQPLSDLHFNADLRIFDGGRSVAHKNTLWLLSLVAGLLLLIAAINFINLETAQSLRRAKEVGVRKVLGGSRKELILQFLSSTFLLAAVSMVIAASLAQWALGYYDNFIPEGLAFNPLNLTTLGIMGLLTIAVCIVAGAYPAFVLSAFRPVRALKDQVVRAGSSGGSVNLRKGLVVFQFVIAQVLIFGTLTIGNQIQYMLNKDMGFEQDAIVYLDTPWRDTTDRKNVLLQELKRFPEVQSISNHSALPAEAGYSTNVTKFIKDGEELNHNVHRKFGDTAFIHLYDIELVAGRNYRQSDTINELLINETYLHELGFQDPNEILGQTIDMGRGMVPIVGVVADFHIQPLYEPIHPTALGVQEGNTISMKLQTAGGDAEDFSTVLSKIENQWKALYPEEPFNYHFVDEDIAKFYEREQETAQLVNTATYIAIFICCLGLFGLISFTTTQRTKEIGIRKILGASVMQLMAILTKSFLWLVIIALLIASPIAWYASRRWLEGYAYPIDIEWWQFVLVGLLGIGIAILTVSFHSFRAATANPVDSLRQE